MSRIWILLLILGLHTSCGETPFDEDYWDETSQLEEEENSTGAEVSQNVSATIAPISPNVGNITGTVRIAVDDPNSTTITELSNVPQSLMIAQRSITNQTCEQVAASFPPPAVVNPQTIFKTVNTTDNSTTAALISELNQADPGNGGSINLVGKTYIIKAYYENANVPGPQSRNIIPVACGTLQVDTSTGNEVSGSGNGTGGITGGVGTNGGTFTGGDFGGGVDGGTFTGGDFGGGTDGGTFTGGDFGGGSFGGTTGF